MSEKNKRELEKEIFEFTTLRVWKEIFPVILDIEETLSDKPEEQKRRLLTVSQDLLESLVSGYFKFHLVEKYLAYNKAREQCSVALFLVYQLGFHRLLEKEKVLDFGRHLRESIKMISSLIKNFENKIKRMDETKLLIEKIKNER